MIAAAAAIEEALALLAGGTAEASAGARAAGAGLNDLDRASGKAGKALAVDLVKAVREAIQQLNALADEIIELKGGAEKYGKQNETLISGAIIFDQILKENYKSAMSMTGAAIIFGDTLISYTKAALKQNDLLVKGYQQLSEFGAVDSTGLRGVLDTIKRVGASPETMEFMLNTIQKNSEQLAMVGGTVSQGAKTFTTVVSDLLDPAEDFYRVLTNLGYTTEDISKFTAGFISINSRTMNGLSKDSDRLKRQTNQYLETLTELAELTGVSRDQQLKAAEELQQEIQWRQYLRELAKEPNGTEKVAAANAIMAEQLSKHGREAANAMMDMIVNNGATRASTAQMIPVYSEAVKTFKEGIKSGANAAQIADEMSKKQASAANRYIDQFGKTAVLDAEAARALGVNYKLYDTANYGMENYLKTVQGVTNGIKTEGDTALNAEARRKQLEMAYANYQQELYFNMAQKAVPAMEIFTQGLIQAAKLLNKFTPDMMGNLRPETALKEFDKLEKAGKLNDITKEQIETTRKLIENQTKTIEQEKIIAQEKAKGPAGDAAAEKRLVQHNEKLKDLQRQREQLEKTANEAAERANKLKQNSNTSQSSNTQNINELLAGLRIKEGPNGALRPGGTVLPETAKAAQEFARLFPNYTQFNAFDDKHHQGKSSSLHPSGRAFDVGVTEKPSDAVLKDLKEKLKEFGVTNLKYESKGDPGSTGNHIHVEVDPTQFKSKKVSMSVPDYSKMDNTALAKSNMQPNSVVGQVSQDNTIVVSKLDDLKTLFDKSLRVQEDILTHTKLLA